MTIIEITIAAYLLVSIFAAVMTYLEQQRKGQSSSFVCLVGFAACALWPVTLSAMIVWKAYGRLFHRI